MDENKSERTPQEVMRAMAIERAIHLCSAPPSDLKVEAGREPDSFWRNVTYGMAEYLARIKTKYGIDPAHPEDIGRILSLDPQAIKENGILEKDRVTLQIYLHGFKPGKGNLYGGLLAITRSEQRRTIKQKGQIPQESDNLIQLVNEINEAIPSRRS